MIVLPDSHIRILAAQESLDYFDTQSVELAQALSPLEAWNEMVARPQPVLQIAFRIRDAISSLFGVKRIGGFSGRRAESVQAGGYLDFFLVEYADDHALVLTERDRHLDVMTCISSEGRRVSVTSSVQVHNRFGRAYMIPVGVAHRWIVRAMFKRLRTAGPS